MVDKICRISLFCTVLACISNTAFAVSVNSRGKSTYAGAYNQVVMMQQQQEYQAVQDVPVIKTASETETLPVEVEDEKLAEDIKNNKSESVTMSDLERCSMIDIRGVFKWGVPESGINKTLEKKCIAVVDLVDADGTKLATTTVAAGDAIKCNIDEFPQNSYTPDAYEVRFPLDEPPTQKDVEKVLNKEQKQNAGFKIAAAAIIGGLAGNALAPKAAGDNKLFGTSKTQMLDTALGAITSAGIMAASSYTGKVAGDTIKSTAVNAAAGMMVGNMTAGLMGSDSVLAVTKCIVDKVEKDCVVGRLSTTSGTIVSGQTDGAKWYTNQSGNRIIKCANAECSFDAVRVLPDSIHINTSENKSEFINKLKPADWQSIRGTYFNPKDNSMGEQQDDSDEPFYEITYAAKLAGTSRPAYAVCEGLSSKIFGYKMSDWEKIKDKCTYRIRDLNSAEAGNALPVKKDDVFTPSVKNAQDGNIIDLSNEARAKATLTGTAAGGALGGFVGYQGAKNEISERWVIAKQEYDDSLYNFACMTGGRVLSKYNDFAAIPQMPNSTEQK